MHIVKDTGNLNLNIDTGAMSASSSNVWKDGDGFTFDKSQKENQDRKNIDLYKEIPLVMKKVKILKKYANKNKLILEEILEVFLTEEDLDIYKNRRKIEEQVRIIQKEVESESIIMDNGTYFPNIKNDLDT